jgi:DNA-binding MarR family transcriptional regulator
MRNSAVTAWLRLARVYQKVDHASVDHLRAWDLSVAQFDVVAQVGVRPGLTQQELAQALLVTKGNICQLVDRLERMSLVRRQQEGRANRLYLTESGQALYAQAVPAQEAMVAERLGALTRGEQRTLLQLLRKLDHALP